MGGTIGVTIRRADGTTHRMGRWTNPLGSLLLDLKFIEGDDSFFNDYISQWDGEWPYCAPVSYGLVVIDYVTKTILHSQGYSALNQLHATDFNRNSIYLGVDQWPESSTVELCKSGRVKRLDWSFKKDDFVEVGKLTGWEEEVIRLEKLTEGMDQMESVNVRWSCRYIADLNPWTIRRFGEDSKSLAQLRSVLVDNGFKFDSTEESHWENYIKERFEDEE